MLAVLFVLPQRLQLTATSTAASLLASAVERIPHSVVVESLAVLTSAAFLGLRLTDIIQPSTREEALEDCGLTELQAIALQIRQEEEDLRQFLHRFNTEQFCTRTLEESCP